MVFLLDELKKENRKQIFIFSVWIKTPTDVVSITAVIAALVADDVYLLESLHHSGERLKALHK